MKLVDILALELKEWPFAATHAYSSGELARFSSCGQTISEYLHIGQEPEDYATARVTRAEWQSAIDALNVQREKGMDINWSKAPESATHHHAETQTISEHWRKEGFFCVVGFEEEGWKKEILPLPISGYTERPVRWNGQGLPPVGTVCERNISRSAWCKTTILAITPQGRNVAYQDAAGQLGWSGCASSFRPIRTPGQIAADERLHKIRNACTAINGKVEQFNVNLDCSVAISATVEAMIDAGYQKFEIVDE